MASGAEKFFESLANQISDKFGLGENTNKSLDIAKNGRVTRYGQLGDFAKNFDHSAERRYLEEGYLRRDTFNVNPKQFEILMQEPEVTVLIKKKMFSSLAENFRPDLMDEQEKLFYKTSRILLQNKCKQIASYEKLSKIERVSNALGEFDTQMLPIVMNLFDEMSSVSFSSDSLFSPLQTNLDTSKLGNVIQKIRKVYAFSPNRTYTSWINDDKTLFRNQLGEGTGVIELTNVTGVTTNTTVDGNAGGSCTINISDPYQLMLITESDIERALSDATNPMNNHKIFQLGKEGADDSIARNTKDLNDKRRARGASYIAFKINPDTLLGDRVVAIVDKLGEKINFTYDSALGLAGLGIGNGVQVNDDSLMGGALLFEEGLNPLSHVPSGLGRLLEKADNPLLNKIGSAVSNFTKGSDTELALFADIITSIYQKIQLENNSRAIINQSNAKINYARRKLRFYFLAKRIIQPMDDVHIYIGSRSAFDNKILGGVQNSFNAYGFLKNANNTMFDLKNSFDTLFNPSGNIDIQLEKSVIVGEHFPNSLWGMMRNQFVNERSGSHVFAGLVEGVKGSNADGKYNVTITAKDNLAYFNQGYANFKPATDVFNGALYDPLTPFKTNFDTVSSNSSNEIPKLLDENQILLDLKLVRYKLGPNAGRLANAGSLLQDRNIDSQGRQRKVYYAPDGLVYKWKEGIGTLVHVNNSSDENDPKTLGSPSVNDKPFAGQDVMNVISLLVTGEPYNFANYYRASVSSGQYLRDPQTNQDSAFSFYTSLRNDLKKRNMNWGNFYPFKSLSMDEETFKKVLDTQLSIISKNDEVDNKIRELLDVKNAFRDINLFKFVPDSEPYKIELEKRLKQLTAEIDQINNKKFESLLDKGSLSSSFSLVGDDVSFDTDEVINTGKPNKNLTSATGRRALRRKLNFLTRRLSWQVRANEDNNLFIVDDYYDKDYDILAFEKSFSGKIEAFNSDFNTIKEKIFGTAQLLNLEVFCDTQGHIRVRPSQYNKMPSSIFYRMLQLKNEKGIQIFPHFLEDLFVNQIDGIIKKIEIIENQIRFAGAIIGKETDLDVVLFINSGAKITPNSEGGFNFLSDSDSWTIGRARDIIKSSDPEQLTDVFSKGIIRGEVFGSSARSAVVKLEFLNDEPVTSVTDSNRLNKLQRRLIMDTSQSVTVDNFLQKTSTGIVATSTTKSADAFKIMKEISEKIAERQRFVKIAHNLLKNLTEAKSLDDSTKTRNNLLFPNLIKNSHIPEIFEAIIEDESYDDLGLNSGKRYIIKNSQIKSIDDSETPPEYTSVQVNGLLDPNGFAVTIPDGLNTFKDGNDLITAAAVDFDMWRMYGMKEASGPVKAPFLHDPEAQCAPYAAAILSRIRKNILQASIVLSGNEYMQPGEVVFVEDRGLLYYVESVTHNFVYGSSFNTTVKLTYGHSPGEYIPTPFDVVGKMFYINRDNTDIINYKQQSSSNEKSLGVIVYNTNSSLALSIKKALFEGENGSHNERVISDILSTTAFTLKSNSAVGTNVKASIEIRVYYNKKTSPSANDDIVSVANYIEQVLKGKIDAGTGNILNSLTKSMSSEEKLIKVVPIDLGDVNEQRSPSGKALDAARNFAKSAGAQDNIKTDSLSRSLYKYVIDCWVIFENISATTPGTPSLELSR